MWRFKINPGPRLAVKNTKGYWVSSHAVSSRKRAAPLVFIASIVVTLRYARQIDRADNWPEHNDVFNPSPSRWEGSS